MNHTVQTRPSNAHRWTKCAAAPQFSAAAGPRPESDEAREGTCAAWVAEEVLTGRAPDCMTLVGHSHANGWTVDADMAAHAQDYVDICRADATDGQTWAECPLVLSDLVQGTADWVALAQDGTLTVRDLKYGYRLVEPDSPQLLIYAAAALRVLPGVTRIVTEIYQPRGFHPLGPRRSRVWTVDDVRDLGQYYAARAVACHQPDPVASAGPHCLYCDAAASCAALQATTAQMLAVVEMQGYRQRTPAEMAQALHFMRWAGDTIKAAASAVEAEAEAMVQSGTRLPGWGMVPRHGQSRVKFPPAAIRALTGGAVSGEKATPMGVGDLRAAWKSAGLPERTLGILIERPVIGSKLTPLDAAQLASQFSGAVPGQTAWTPSVTNCCNLSNAGNS
jgi:hypothetical protein